MPLTSKRKNSHQFSLEFRIRKLVTDQLNTSLCTQSCPLIRTGLKFKPGKQQRIQPLNILRTGTSDKCRVESQMLFKAGARLPFDFLYFCLVLGSQRKRSATSREEHLGSVEFLLVETILRMEICPKQQLCSQNSLMGEYIARSRGSPTQILICLLLLTICQKIQLAILFLGPLKTIFQVRF